MKLQILLLVSKGGVSKPQPVTMTVSDVVVCVCLQCGDWWLGMQANAAPVISIDVRDLLRAVVRYPVKYNLSVRCVFLCNSGAQLGKSLQCCFCS